MARTTDPDKRITKLKKHAVEQHLRLSFAMQVIDKAKEHPAIGDIILQIIREIKGGDEYLNSRQADLDQLMKIFND